jgi:chemotaxis protein histidine kinase CheA
MSKTQTKTPKQKKTEQYIGMVYGGIMKHGWCRLFTVNENENIEEVFNSFINHYGPDVTGRYVPSKDLEADMEKIQNDESINTCGVENTDIYQVNVSNMSELIKKATENKRCHFLGKKDEKEDKEDKTEKAETKKPKKETEKTDKTVGKTVIKKVNKKSEEEEEPKQNKKANTKKGKKEEEISDAEEEPEDDEEEEEEEEDEEEDEPKSKKNSKSSGKKAVTKTNTSDEKKKSPKKLAK